MGIHCKLTSCMKTILCLIQLFIFSNVFCQNIFDTVKFKVVEEDFKINHQNILITTNVLRKRLVNLGYNNSKIEFNAKKNEINISGVKFLSVEIIKDWLIKPIKVELFECYSLVEILDILSTPKSKISKKNQKQFFTLINATDDYLKSRAPSNIGDVMIEDSANLNGLVKKIKNYLPLDCFMAYQNADKSANVYLEYYALKKSKYQININEVLDTAKLGIDYRGKPNIAIVFNKEGTKQFASLTQKNTGKAIAILIDGFVYSAPFVNGAVEGGRAEISGNFTIIDAKNFANMLNAGSLPLKLSLMH